MFIGFSISSKLSILVAVLICSKEGCMRTGVKLLNNPDSVSLVVCVGALNIARGLVNIGGCVEVKLNRLLFYFYIFLYRLM